MCARPRSRSDADVATAAARVLSRLGAEHVRLSDVAAESGLAPATLVQRFGSRNGVLQAIGEVFVLATAAAFRVEADSQLARLTTALTSIDARTHLLFFGPRPGQAAAYSLELRKQIGFSLSAAVENGELPPCGIADLARRIQLGYYGLVCASLLESVPINAESTDTLISHILADV